MFLNEPQPTPYDLHFRIGNVPVTVNPWFWLISILLSGVGQGETGINILIGVAVVFVSILVHEFGHAIAMMRYGERVRIVLYGMGGLAIPDGFGAWDGARRRSRGYVEQIIISFAGPLAGFILAGIVIVVSGAVGCRTHFLYTGQLPLFFFVLVGPPPGMFLSGTAMYLINKLLFVNIFWGLINLLPVYPLDGGQISRAAFQMYDYRNGLVKSLWVSLIVGAAMAIWGLVYAKSLWTAYLFGMLAYGSWQALQQFRNTRW